jgi:hypothetical protein
MDAAHGYTLKYLARAFQINPNADVTPAEILAIIWWKPLEERLHRLVTATPTEIVCVNNAEQTRQRNHIQSLSEVMVGIVVPGNEVIYLCDVLNDNESLLARTSNNAKSNVIRVDAQCLVFTDEPEVTDDVLPLAIKECLQMYSPPIADLPIRWLPPDVMLAIFDEASAK